MFLRKTRINIAQSIIIGNHVWLGDQVITGGAVVEDGSIGIRGLVTGIIHNSVLLLVFCR